ncbi:MAG: cadherin-like beta sandwich domain-containing protein [Sulfuricella sp.]|nr:cadherin-like beta sandwich domain-containing protein [Sulfuricella sp.]
MVGKDSLRLVVAFFVSILMMLALDAQAAISIPTKAGVNLSTAVVSDNLPISGIVDGTPISLSGDASAQYNIYRGSAWLGWTSLAGTLNNNDAVAVSIQSSSSYLTSVTATLTIGVSGASSSGDFVVTTKASSDATLSALTLSSGTLSPAFAGGTTAYAVAVDNATSNITVTPTATFAGATAKVNTTASPSTPVNLNVGTNTVTVDVTAQDGATTQSYTLTVTRASSGGSAPVFSNVAPANGAFINNVTTSSALQYTLSSDLASGNVVITQVGGTADSNVHTCVLKGNALKAGSHTLDLSDTTNSCASDVSNLVSGAIYDIVLSGLDAASNSATGTLGIVNVTFDTSAPVLSNVAPADGASISNVTAASAIQYTLSKDLASGTVSFSVISGTDASAPHTCTLKGNALHSGVHTLDLSDTTNACTADVSNLVSGVVYGMSITGKDAAGNDAKWTYGGITLTGVAVGNIAFTAPASAVVANSAVAQGYNCTTYPLGCAGGYVGVTFSGNLKTPATAFATSAFAVKVNGQSRTISNVAVVGGNGLGIYLSAPMVAGDTVTVSYTVPATNPLQDAGGNNLAGFADFSVTNVSAFPLCSSDATVSCIDSVAVVGGTNSNNSFIPVVYISGGNIQVQLTPSDYGYDLSTAGYDTTTQFRIALKIRGYTPRMLGGAGRNASWSIGTAVGGVVPVTINVSPVHQEYISPTPSLDNWPTNNVDKAASEKLAGLSVFVSDLSYPGFTEEQKNANTGIVLVTDAQVFGLVSYTAATNTMQPSLNTLVGGPHFNKDGSLHFGFFEAHLPASMLSYWGVTDINKLLASYLDSGTFTVTPEGSGARIDLDIHYSSGNVRISVQAAASAPAASYDPGPVAAPVTAITSDSGKPVAIAEGGTATLGASATLVAGAGSTISVDMNAKVDGATISLPSFGAASGSGGAASASPKPVTISIGGQTLSITPTSADTVLMVKVVSVDGVPTPVLEVTSGTVTMSSSQSNQPLLAVGGGKGSGVIVVTADTAGTLVSSSVSVGTGETVIAVASGVVTLPTDAFASTNGFAAVKGGKLYAGETAVLNGSGKISGVYLGSSSGKGGAVGDPLVSGDIGNLNLRVWAVVPKISGTSSRIGSDKPLEGVVADVIGAATGMKVASSGQDKRGMLRLETGSGSIFALPVGKLAVDTSRADGISFNAQGKAEVVKNGVIITFASTASDFSTLAGELAALDKNATVTVTEDGLILVTLNNVSYPLQPGWLAGKTGGGQHGIVADAQGRLAYQDGGGTRQTLYPAFAEPAQLLAAVKALDGDAKATGTGDGCINLQLLGKTYTLMPEAALASVPAAHAQDAWWVGEDGKLFIKSGTGKRAQGFRVK